MSALIWDSSSSAYKESEIPKVYSGGAFVDSEGKHWNGSAWVEAWSTFKLKLYKVTARNFTNKVLINLPQKIHYTGNQDERVEISSNSIPPGTYKSISVYFDNFTGGGEVYVIAYPPDIDSGVYAVALQSNSPVVLNVEGISNPYMIVILRDGSGGGDARITSVIGIK